MILTKNQHIFLELVRAGLFHERVVQEFNVQEFKDVAWSEVYRLSEEQSVVGLVTAGLELVQGEWFKVHGSPLVPQELALQFIGSSLQIEQTNKGMNAFVAKLIDHLRKQGIYALLVKGQGIAQCYEKPLWRSSGDVDLLLSDDNYMKAAESLKAIAASVDEENTYNKHLAMTIDGWSVELHGTLRSGLWKDIDRVLDGVQGDVLFGGKVRSWMVQKVQDVQKVQGQGVQVFLPGADEDVVFVFSHILQHFFKEGIGLRQICDWCRLLYTYREKLDLLLLESRIRKAGIMSEWRAFATLAVQYLGMPEAAMPMFGSKVQEFKGKADKVMRFVLETGNFGHNRDYSYYQKYPYLVFKAISLWRHITDTYRYFRIFPLDSLKVLWRKMRVGSLVAVRGGLHE